MFSRSSAVTEAAVLDALRVVHDPDLHKDIVTLGFLVVWLYCMFRAFQGERFKLPYLGEVAEKQVWPSERA